tara:strand:- start:3396 stop:4664 length:1269 start_codon:yes stop_codon:yes gene_type:complete
MDRVNVWERSDLTDDRWRKCDGRASYAFQNGFKKEFLGLFPEHSDAFIPLGLTTKKAYKVYNPVSSLKAIKKQKYYYPIPWVPAPDSKHSLQEVIEIDQVHLDNLKSNRCKLLVINVMEGWNHDGHFQILIDAIKEKYNLQYDNFVLLSGNLDETPYGVPTVYYNWWEQHMNDHGLLEYAKHGFNSTDTVTRPNRFLCLNRRPHGHRILLTNALEQYKDLGILTCAKETDFGSLHLFRKALHHVIPEHYPKLKEELHETNDFPNFLNRLPFTYDDGYNAADDNPTVDESRDKFYNSWLHVVTETYQTNGQTFFSEKIFKPMIYWQPFILVGAQHDLKSLRSFGYKTFDGIIDETYDTIENNEERLKATIKEIERIIKLSDEDIAKLYKECYEVLTHNFFHWVYRNQTIHIGLKNDLLEKLNG